MLVTIGTKSDNLTGSARAFLNFRDPGGYVGAKNCQKHTPNLQTLLDRKVSGLYGTN